MKTGYCLSGLALGLLVGVGVGYKIASNPRNRVKVRNFFNDVEEQIKGVEEKVKTFCSSRSKTLSEEERAELELLLTKALF